jgi:hypothetical protein
MSTHTAENTKPAKGADIASREWKGPWRRYDIIKEGVIAIVVVSILTVLLAGLFSSPDEPGHDLPRSVGNSPHPVRPSRWCAGRRAEPPRPHRGAARRIRNAPRSTTRKTVSPNASRPKGACSTGREQHLHRTRYARRVPGS